MKISVITVALNEALTIRRTFESVKLQTYKNFEHIIVDGGSSDDTMLLAEEYASNAPYPVKVISQKGMGRIYGALNEGIAVAVGDVVATLHANDFYASPEELEAVASAFQDAEVKVAYGNIRYVDYVSPDKVRGYYSSKHFCRESLLDFFAPPHPATFIRRDVFETYGYYSEDFLIAGDFELMVRLILVNRVKMRYIDRCMVCMTTGGLSTTLRHRLTTNVREKWRALKQNNQKCSCLSILKRYLYALKW